MFPVIRIDHIFYSNQFVALNTYVVNNSGGSDHFPVVAELYLKINLSVQGSAQPLA